MAEKRVAKSEAGEEDLDSYEVDDAYDEADDETPCMGAPVYVKIKNTQSGANAMQQNLAMQQMQLLEVQKQLSAMKDVERARNSLEMEKLRETIAGLKLEMKRTSSQAKVVNEKIPAVSPETRSRKKKARAKSGILDGVYHGKGTVKVCGGGFILGLFGIWSDYQMYTKIDYPDWECNVEYTSQSSKKMTLKTRILSPEKYGALVLEDNTMHCVGFPNDNVKLRDLEIPKRGTFVGGFRARGIIDGGLFGGNTYETCNESRGERFQQTLM